MVARRPEPQPTGVELFLQPDAVSAIAGRWAGLFFPVVAVVDAESGRLLRLTRYRGGRPVLRQELRDVADVDPADDFAFTPPPGLPVGGEDEDAWPGRMGSTAPDEGLDLGDAARSAADALKKQVDEKVAAARGFLDSFLGGGELAGRAAS